MSAPQANGHAAPADTSAQTSKVQPSDVGWQFVPQYYNFVNKQPHRLHCFYNKHSTFIHGEEGDDAQPALGQAEIHERINAIGYDQCKVFIHSIDSQSSANGGIIILVIGEMSNKGAPWRKFTQTFFLAEQPNGYFVLNDIFRYLKEDVEEDEDDEDLHPQEPSQQEAAVEVPAAAPSVPDVDPVPVPETSAPTPVPEAAEPVEEAKEAAPEPEPVQAPAHPDPKAVPEEAVIASVPDKDVAPAEKAAAVEEPVTSSDPVIEETKAPLSPAATPPQANGKVAPSAPAAAPAAAASAQPAAPAAPAKPKSWAALAASGASKAWGAAAAPAATPAPAAAPAAAPAPAAPQPKKEETAAPASLEGKHAYYVNAAKATSPICFVKLPNWSADGVSNEPALTAEQIKSHASKFGEVKSVEVVGVRACAFVEFAKVESARKAIIQSLTQQQGGEGGVVIPGYSRPMTFETRKEKEDRRKGGAGQGAQQGQGGQRGGRQGVNGERGGAPGRGGRGGRGRGGAAAGAKA